jgi:hypothetical protein
MPAPGRKFAFWRAFEAGVRIAVAGRTDIRPEISEFGTVLCNDLVADQHIDLQRSGRCCFIIPLTEFPQCRRRFPRKSVHRSNP